MKKCQFASLKNPFISMEFQDPKSEFRLPVNNLLQLIRTTLIVEKFWDSKRLSFVYTWTSLEILLYYYSPKWSETKIRITTTTNILQIINIIFFRTFIFFYYYKNTTYDYNFSSPPPHLLIFSLKLYIHTYKIKYYHTYLEVIIPIYIIYQLIAL